VGWTALASGQAILIAPGDTIAAIVSVDQSLTRSRLEHALSDHLPGVILDDYAEQGERANLGPDPDSSRKYIAVKAHSVSYSGSLSWSKGIFLVAPNLYTIVEAWKAEAGSVPASLPSASSPAPASRSASVPIGPWLLILSGIGILGYAAYQHRDGLCRALVRA